ncbi:MAG: TetR family transcriptional regulator C-terminal domain-containing protein [Aliidongia sp.]
MPKPSNRDKILTEGLRVVHEHGFAGASVRDIVQAAGVPQGSFTNHFVSKEAFGVEILDLYFANNWSANAETLRNEALPPLQRLRLYIESSRDRLYRDGMRNGCLLGNFTAEATDHSEAIRLRLIEIFAEVQQAIADVLRAAVAAGELPADFECDEVAGFIQSSMQGANLMAKAQRSSVPVDRLLKILFSSVLR